MFVEPLPLLPPRHDSPWKGDFTVRSLVLEDLYDYVKQYLMVYKFEKTFCGLRYFSKYCLKK